MNLPEPSRVRFGAFELDLRSGELRPVEAGNGVRTIVLQEQPFQVLRLLIERNGEVATREEIRKNLWPNDTAVDFNHSINVAIGTLRRALRDSTEEPQYIETVARRGYRFIAQTEWVRTAEEPSGVEADHGLVDLDLLLGVHAADRVEDLAVDGIDRLAKRFRTIGYWR